MQQTNSAMSLLLKQFRRITPIGWKNAQAVGLAKTRQPGPRGSHKPKLETMANATDQNITVDAINEARIGCV